MVASRELDRPDDVDSIVDACSDAFDCEVLIDVIELTTNVLG